MSRIGVLPITKGTDRNNAISILLAGRYITYKSQVWHRFELLFFLPYLILRDGRTGGEKVTIKKARRTISSGLDKLSDASRLFRFLL
jgi:hypothetical protein